MTRVPAILIADFPDRDEVAAAAARRWGPTDEVPELVSQGASFTFVFEDGHRRRYLRVTPPGWRNEPEVRGEIAFIRHLAGCGTPVAPPVPSIAGEFVETVTSSLGQCLAVAFEEVRGAHADPWSIDQARETGRLMASMHVASSSFSLPAGTSRLSWRNEFRGLEGELDPADTELRDIARELAGLLSRLPTDLDCYGVIHFDLMGDNLIWRDSRPVAVDFDDCMEHWYIADLARVIAHLRSDESADAAAREQSLLRGYHEVRALDERSAQLLLQFVRLSHLSELAWLAYASRTAPSKLELSDRDERRLRRLVIDVPTNR